MHPAFATPRDSLGAELPAVPTSLPDSHPDACSLALIQRVGPRLTRRDLTEAELREHIADLTTLWLRADARFQAHQSPPDRDEALRWLDECARAETALARLDQGVGYFSSDAAQALGQAGAA